MRIIEVEAPWSSDPRQRTARIIHGLNVRIFTVTSSDEMATDQPVIINRNFGII